MKMATSRSRGNKDRDRGLRRCAIYVRQSVDRGDKELSSCEAQRSAIEAYVRTQEAAGWVALPERYDDSGFSGANTARPAFQRLLRDVEAGEVDVVAVYRIDRLSRSMLDFTSTLKQFSERSVAFVSISQQFDTSTSTGQLMANMLASFSQFEREQIGERIRDKLIETRRRGGWQAGGAPFGYRTKGGALHVNDAEAAVARKMFSLYLALSALSDVVRELNARGYRMRRGKLWTKQSTHRVLRSKTLAGWVPCGEEWFEGKQERVIDRESFELVQKKLTAQRKRGGATAKNKHGYLLRGLIYCAKCGRVMISTYSASRGRIFRYYVCRATHNVEAERCSGARVSALEIEGFLAEQIQSIGQDPRIVAESIDRATVELRTGRPQLESERRYAREELRKYRAERERLIEGIVAGGPAVKALGERIAEVDERIVELERSSADAHAELVAMDSAVVSEGEIRNAFHQFQGIWTQLLTRERIRVLNLLIERIDFDGASGDVAIRFRPGGIRVLAETEVATT